MIHYSSHALYHVCLVGTHKLWRVGIIFIITVSGLGLFGRFCADDEGAMMRDGVPHNVILV